MCHSILRHRQIGRMQSLSQHLSPIHPTPVGLVALPSEQIVLYALQPDQGTQFRNIFHEFPFLGHKIKNSKHSGLCDNNHKKGLTKVSQARTGSDYL